MSEPNVSDRSVIDCNLFTFWTADKNDETPWIELDFGKKETFNFFSMHAGYKKTIQKYVIEAYVGKEWVSLFTGTEATFHEKYPFKEVKARKYRIRILEKKGNPEIRELTFVKY